MATQSGLGCDVLLLGVDPPGDDLTILALQHGSVTGS